MQPLKEKNNFHSTSGPIASKRGWVIPQGRNQTLPHPIKPHPPTRPRPRYVKPRPVTEAPPPGAPRLLRMASSGGARDLGQRARGATGLGRGGLRRRRGGGPGRAEGAPGRKEASEGGREERARSYWAGAAEPP